MSFTKSDKQFLKDNFVTKDDLVSMEKRQDKKYSTKDDLKDLRSQIGEDVKDLRSQITDDIDGKLKIQKREMLSEIDTKLAKQKEDIVNSVAKDIVETIVPLIDEQNTKIAVIQRKVGLSPLDN